jgi:GH24 family phage-related lysozyme (muramidase)
MFWHLFDIRQNLIATLDNTGTLTELMRYDEFGFPTVTTVGAPSGIEPMFGGMRQLNIPGTPPGIPPVSNWPSGPYLGMFRLYDASNGVWMSQDPLGYTDGPNRSAYVGQSPMNCIDPMGLSARDSAWSGAASPSRPNQFKSHIESDGGTFFSANHARRLIVSGKSTTSTLINLFSRSFFTSNKGALSNDPFSLIQPTLDPDFWVHLIMESMQKLFHQAFLKNHTYVDVNGLKFTVDESNEMHFELPEVPEGYGSDALGEAGVGFIRQNEGWGRHPYRDTALHATIGWGHKLWDPPPTQEQSAWIISDEEAASLNNWDIMQAQKMLQKQVGYKLSQGQEIAMIDFIFNVGSLGRQLRKAVSTHNWNAVTIQLPHYNKARNQKTKKMEVNPGLAHRRDREIKFINGR